MKLSLFLHMERISAEDDQQRLYEEMMQLCEIADQGGLHAIWTGEHHGMNFTIAPNPFINLVDIAHRTRNVRLGTGTIIAPFTHPIRLAGEAAMTDLITGGRLDLGIARGAYAYEYERLMPGMDAWQAGQRMRELVPAIKALWEGDYTHQGEYWNFPATTSSPKPVQTPHPPIWVAARDPNSHDFAVKNGCNVQCTPLHQGDEEIERLIGCFHGACREYLPEKPLKIMLLQHGYVAGDEEDAWQAATEIHRFYNYFGAWFKNQRPVRQGLIQALSEEEIAASNYYSVDAMRKNLAIGCADEVIARLKKYEALGYDEYALWLDNGMTFERKKACLERFIRHVAPEFR
ncbi:MULTISPECIES: LLM class flavin-dependent oxidoreductase [Tatumella]|uniref:LLM class flavin-dependent oxidoreductase n=1 Tax=Tatumella punctata TaxID=399969 RepID=A0ABW1VJT2_9GAMM|nr:MULTISPECIES: LLM class flavin-dependent oxidoreductase [unclassified Tatumella]MBS0855514.1 LLM class flavin-dependent oxidoreductase [Tatumella sp. JGM16]MBS0877104.1 LLM class flavin-dependent oxidoreductase [Tatumella sp. JGM82]MBS0890628.1 LLM class flavin-dependent oxidoreductase [Tatumella sp. JGM94]MBS0901407.1 LLM class flavin-dependent oxidoreductase [Tatumella sp. JGM100]MBS0912291.1 LLM class flavin-dependent oxidoreductase [Tatumella sp. JGM91]